MLMKGRPRIQLGGPVRPRRGRGRVRSLGNASCAVLMVGSPQTRKPLATLAAIDPVGEPATIASGFSLCAFASRPCLADRALLAQLGPSTHFARLFVVFALAQLLLQAAAFE